MSAPAVHLLVGIRLHVSPLGLLVVEDHLGHFFVGVIVESSYEVASSVAESEGGVLTRCWNPILMSCGCQFGVESFPFLHSLNVGLEDSS